MAASLGHVMNKCMSPNLILSKLLGRTTYHSNLNSIKCLGFSNTLISAKSSFPSYYDVQKLRKDQANRSLLILQVGPTQELIDFCQKYGDVNKVFQIKRNDKHYILLEFKDVKSLRRLSDNVNQFPNLRRIPIESRFLYFRPAYHRSDLLGLKNRKVVVSSLDDSRLCDNDLQTCSTVSSQISLLHKKLSMSDLDFRVRYFLCSEVESFLNRVFPSAAVNLFGSSVTGFGRFDCDIDMTFDLDAESSNQGLIHTRPGSLYYLTKLKPESDRSFSQKTLEVIGGLLQQFMPQMINVRRILKARVPIVKFVNAAIDIECDLCLDNKSAVQMSQALYNLCHSDERVGQLAFTIRHWARCCGITQSNPGPWLSNFMLTLLVVYSLQAHPQAILPPLKAITGGASVGSQEMPKKNSVSETQNLEELLLHFFKFYAELDLSQSAISVVDGCVYAKPDQSPLFILNPVETDLNVSKNVLDSYLERFQSLCRSARDSLETQRRERMSGTPWGLLTILKAEAPKTRDKSQESPTDGGNFEEDTAVDLPEIEDVLVSKTLDKDERTSPANIGPRKLNISMQSILNVTDDIDSSKVSN